MSNTVTSESKIEGLKNIPPFKPKTIPLEHLKVDPTINIRMQRGDNAFGFVTNFSTVHLESLKERIMEAKGVLVPLLVWKVDPAKEEYTIIRGNTRFLSCKELVADPSCPADLLKNISKLRCDVVEGISADQARALVNDQDQQRYNKADFVNHCWKLAAAGWSYYEIGLQFTDLYAEYIGTNVAKQKLMQFRGMKDKFQQREFIKSWCRGELDQGILTARKLGPRVQKAFLLNAAKASGVLQEDVKDEAGNVIKVGDEQPEFNTSKRDGTITRLAALKKVADEDPSWTPSKGSPTFDALIQKYIMADTGKAEAPTGPTRLTAGNLKDRQKESLSTAFKTAYAVALGEKPENAMAVDASAFRAESIMAKLEAIFPSITDKKVASLIAVIIKSQNPDELGARLEQFTKSE